MPVPTRYLSTTARLRHTIRIYVQDKAARDTAADPSTQSKGNNGWPCMLFQVALRPYPFHTTIVETFLISSPELRQSQLPPASSLAVRGSLVLSFCPSANTFLDERLGAVASAERAPGNPPLATLSVRCGEPFRQQQAPHARSASTRGLDCERGMIETLRAVGS